MRTFKEMFDSLEITFREWEVISVDREWYPLIATQVCSKCKHPRTYHRGHFYTSKGIKGWKDTVYAEYIDESLRWIECYDCSCKMFEVDDMFSYISKMRDKYVSFEEFIEQGRLENV